MQFWPKMQQFLKPGKTLYFSHGFAVTFSKQTGVIPPAGVDVVIVAPKGSGRSVRRLFKEGKGINSSFAIHQDATGHAREKAIAFGIGIGSGYLFETTSEKEVLSDLVGERGVLMGALAGMIEAQFDILRKNGHSPSEAFNETVEEATQSLIPLIAENGMDWMFANCSTTAQRGALDWRHRFREAVRPVFEDLYNSVKSGKEAEITIKANSAPDYKEKLDAELSEMRNSELWQAGAAVRKLRP
jgi:ketol-acid reductoisomerase